MRVAAGLILAGAISAALTGAAWSQTPAAKAGGRGPPAAAAPAPPAGRRRPQPPQPARAACNNPNALGVARTVEIDTTGGPGFGFEHFKELDFLRDKEVVLTFDDGPWPNNTPAVLKALADECTTGIFFSIGKHATYYPEILKQVYAAGHTVGTHTWSHANARQQEAQRRSAQGRDREGHQRREMGARRHLAGTVLPLPGAAASAGDGHLSRQAQHRDLLLRHRLLRLQVPQARAGRSNSS